MIFSIFSRKAARLAQRKRDLARESQPADGVLSSADTVAATTLGIGPATVDARELARQTAAKIDAIESEMIHGRVTPAGPATRIARTGLAGTVFVPSGRVASVGAGVGAGAGVMPPIAMPAEGPAANAITIQVPSSGETLEVQREFTMARTPPTLHLKPGKEKSLLRRHPWIYANAIDRASGGPASGDTVRVLGADGRFLAWAAFSPTSALRARAWSFTEAEHPDAAFIAARVAAAVARREGLQAQTEAIRLVFGEADALPGLVVDRYRDQLVVQFLAAGVEHWRDVIVAALREVTGCEAVYERSDAAAREREGLVPREGVLHGDLPAPLAVSEHGVRYEVDVITGHKTGFYIDQRDSRRLVGEHAHGRRVLNCFCSTGGFTLAARLGGAVEAVSVDSSAEALAVAARNEQLNGLAPSTWLQANVFDALKNLLAEGRQFDLIVLDPPKFAPSV